jgi:hypothetical protein
MEFLDLPTVLTLRLTVPLLIFKFPLIGLLASIHLDNIDWIFFNVQNDSQYFVYQVIDKVLDTYFLTIALLVAWTWKDISAKRVAIYTYTWRLLGTILFFLTQNQILLIFFPNYFETFFLFYLIFRLFEKRDNLFSTAKSFWVILPLLLVPKMVHELIHLPPSYAIPLFDQYKDSLIVGSYLVFLTLALIWRLKQKK